MLDFNMLEAVLVIVAILRPLLIILMGVIVGIFGRYNEIRIKIRSTEIVLIGTRKKK